MTTSRAKSLLLVEDNDDDVFFMRRAIASAGVNLPLQVAETGQVAIDYLSGVNGYADRSKHPLPFLLFLDLKLPQKSGLEVLAFIRGRPELKTLVVLVLTSSREDSDVQKAYTLGANSFLVKPPNGAQLNELMKLVRAYWLDNPQLALP